MIKQCALLLIALLATGVCLGEQRPNPIVLPAQPVWSLTLEIEGKKESLLLPKDRARVESLSETARANANREIKRVEGNQRWVREVGQVFVAPKTMRGHRLTPDYEKVLNEVAISVSAVEANAERPLWRHQPILKVLPSHSRIHIITPPAAAEAVRKQLAESGLLSRAHIYPLPAAASPRGEPTKYSRSTRWIRDTFMVGSTPDKKATAYFPLAYATTTDLASSDVTSIKPIWHDRDLTYTFPAFIRGGNVAVADNMKGERVAFLGNDEIEQNALRFNRTTGLVPPRAMAVEILQKLAGTSKVLVLPNSDLLFHIDMAFNFLGPGSVALLAPVDEPNLGKNDIEVLQIYRKALAAAGFRVVSIPTTAERISRYQSPVNFVPFADKLTGQRRAIVPEYPDVKVSHAGRQESLNGLVKKAYAEAGVEVIWAEDRFSDTRGGVHCALLGLN